MHARDILPSGPAPTPDPVLALQRLPSEPTAPPPVQVPFAPSHPSFPPPGTAPPYRRGLRPRSWVLVGALVAGLLLAGWGAGRPWAAGQDSSGPAGSPVSHAFLGTDPRTGAPVGYDPCETVIHYVIRPDGSPPDGDAIVAEAFAEVSAATGYTFVLDGHTSLGPVDSVPALWAEQSQPVLVAWATQAESADLAGDVVGWAGSVQAPSLHGGQAYRTGQVVLDTADLSPELDRRDGRAQVRAVIMHEVGHLLGLDHVEDPTQLMYEFTTPTVTAFGAGDLAGLAAIGTGRCPTP